MLSNNNTSKISLRVTHLNIFVIHCDVAENTSFLWFFVRIIHLYDLREDKIITDALLWLPILLLLVHISLLLQIIRIVLAYSMYTYIL